jgi:malate dehydrogenase
MQDWIFGTRENDWTSMGIPSDGSYGIPEGVVYSYPVTCRNGHYSVVQGLELSDFDKEKMKISYAELVAEQNAVRHLL